MRRSLRGVLVGAIAAMAVIAAPLAVTAPATADAVIGPVVSLGEHDVDVDGTPHPAYFWNASFGSSYLFMTGVVSDEREVTAVDLTTGKYVADWVLSQGVEPNGSLVADGDAVWTSTLFGDTQVHKVGRADPVADFAHTYAVAVVDDRAYLFGDGSNTPVVTVLDDNPSSPGYLTPIATPIAPASLADAVVVASAGDRIFVNNGTTIEVVDADPTSPSYLTVTGSAPSPPEDLWLASDADGGRLLSWTSGGVISVFDDRGGELTAAGSLNPCAGQCVGGIVAALSPDGRRAYVTTGDVPDEVRVYDLTTPSYPQVAAIESFAGAESMTLGLSPDGTRLTTGGGYPKIATVAGFASTPTLTAPQVPLPGNRLSVDLGDWSTAPTWQWLRNGTPIAGTTDAATYRVTAADLGTRLTVRADDGTNTRTSASVALPRPPRITATVTGRRLAGWYLGRATVRFTCTAGTARIVHCPSAVTLGPVADHRVRRSVSDQYGLRATVSRSGLDVCDRCVAGATYAAGRWVVRRGRDDTVAIVGGGRPQAAGLARPGRRATVRPVTARRDGHVGSRTVWLVGITAPRGRGHRTLFYRHGSTTGRIPLTVR